MVKTRVSRSLAHRFNPLSDPSSDCPEPDLITRLRSPDDSEREVACISAGTLRTCADPDSIVKVLLERISDPNAQVRLAALQACDSLTVSYSQNLLSAGVVTLLEFTLNRYFSLETTLYESEVERQTAVMTTGTAVNLLASLCENSSTLLAKLTSSNFIPHVLSYLASGTDRLLLVTPCMSLLQVLSEDNAKFLQATPQHMDSTLLSLLQELGPGLLREQVAIAQVLFNYYTLQESAENIRSVVVPIVLRVAGLDIWREYTESVQPKLREGGNLGKTGEVWGEASIAVEEVLELMTNLLYSDSEEEASEFFPVLVSIESVSRLMSLAMGLPIDLVTQLTDIFEQSLQDNVFSVQTAAINVLKNIILTGSSLIGREEALDVCGRFYRLCADWEEKREDVMSKENLDLVISGALGLMNICVKKLDLALPVEWFPLFLTLAGAGHLDTAVNGVSLLASLNKIPHSLSLNAEVCKQLLTSCRSKSLSLVNEALNAFFDIYNEEVYDSVLHAAGVIPLMQQGLPLFQEMARKEEDEDLRDTAELTATNLVDFIEYKLSHMQ